MKTEILTVFEIYISVPLMSLLLLVAETFSFISIELQSVLSYHICSLFTINDIFTMLNTVTNQTIIGIHINHVIPCQIEVMEQN